MNMEEKTIVEFSLEFKEGEIESDIPYTLSLGDHYLQSYISDWSNDFNRIRYDMEALSFYHPKGAIQMFYEDEPTIISFEGLTVREVFDDEVIFKEILHIKVTPNSFISDAQPFEGYCMLKDFVKTFYGAFMKLGHDIAICKDYYDREHFAFLESRFSAYNILKSGMVEVCINPLSQIGEVVQRQIQVNHFLTINPVKGEFILGYDDVGVPFYVIINSTDIVSIVGFHPITIQGISEWMKQKNEMDESFDWAEWDERGISYEKQIKSVLPSDYDVWYQSHDGKMELMI